jgi:hypothetical protein
MTTIAFCPEYDHHFKLGARPRIGQRSVEVCEANSGPGFKGFEQTTGLNVPRQIYQYIQVRLSGNRSAATVVDDVQSGVRTQDESVPNTDLSDEQVFQIASGYPT